MWSQTLYNKKRDLISFNFFKTEIENLHFLAKSMLVHKNLKLVFILHRLYLLFDK